MPDIVERLRTLHRMYSIGGTTLDEAADTITALRAEVEQLREILDIAVDDHDSSMGRSNVPAHWSNRARAALSSLTEVKDGR